MYDIFLSHSSNDKAWVRELARRIDEEAGGEAGDSPGYRVNLIVRSAVRASRESELSDHARGS